MAINNPEKEIMKVGIIGYGSMGKMILEKIAEAEFVRPKDLYVASRTYEK